MLDLRGAQIIIHFRGVPSEQGDLVHDPRGAETEQFRNAASGQLPRGGAPSLAKFGLAAK